MQQHATPFNLQNNPVPAGEQLWLQQIRQNALQHFVKHGFPTTRQEDWKYTKITPLAEQVYYLPTRTQVSAEQIAEHLIPNLDSYLLVFVNGQYQTELAELSGLPAGVILCELTEALTQQPALVQAHLTKIAATAKHGLSALNTAHMQTGYFLHVPANIKLTKPIQLIFLSTEQELPTTYQLRNLVIADTHSKLTLIENYIGIGSTNYWTNTLTEIHVEDHAQVEHFKLLQESQSAYHTGTLSVQQGAHSQLNSHSFALGGRLIRSDSDIVQTAEYVSSELNGLYLAKGKQHIDHHTSIDHAQAYGSSRELYKGIIDEQGRAVFNGRVLVRQDAQKINAAQTNKNLLLSEQAEIDTKPQLEIYADDVKCAHGATVGQLNASELFYLRSRGLNEQTARSILTFAFANELLEFVNQIQLRNYLRHCIIQQLAQDPTILEML
jgi:Fe-S cluster assembly protein SufD